MEQPPSIFLGRNFSSNKRKLLESGALPAPFLFQTTQNSSPAPHEKSETSPRKIPILLD